MFIAVLVAIAAFFLLPAFWATTPLYESIIWSFLASLFPLSVVCLVLINLKGTLAGRIKTVSDQIQKFEGSLRSKLIADENSEQTETWILNLNSLDTQRDELNSKYKIENFQSSFAFLGAVYSVCFFLAFSKILPITDFGKLLPTIQSIPNSTVVAVFGAWVYALYSVIARISTADQSPQFLLRLSFQPIMAASFATFATFMFANNFVLLISFGTGFLPYTETVRWLRVQTQKRLNNTAEGGTPVDTGSAELSEIDGIDFDEIDRLNEENIKGIQQLAFSNPLEIHFSTTYPLKTIVDWTDQALLRLYLNKDQISALKLLGIRGAIDMTEANTHLQQLKGKAEQETDAAVRTELLAQHTALVTAIGTAIGSDQSAALCISYQLSEDPHIRFIYFIYDELASAS